MLEALLGSLIVAVVTTVVQHLIVGRHAKAARTAAEKAEIHAYGADAAGVEAVALLKPAVAQLPKTRRKKAPKADSAGGPDLPGVS